jgi:CheY-like chemotaxis protein
MPTPSKALQRRRVLVVDDNLDHVQSLALLLKSMGHDTEFAITGQAALIAARRFRPDVVSGSLVRAATSF